MSPIPWVAPRGFDEELSTPEGSSLWANFKSYVWGYRCRMKALTIRVTSFVDHMLFQVHRYRNLCRWSHVDSMERVFGRTFPTGDETRAWLQRDRRLNI